MFRLKNIIGSLFGRWEDKYDTNKVNGRGMLRRYNECVAEEFDETTLLYLTDILKNTVDPENMMAKFLPYWENTLYVPILDADVTLRRKVIQYSIRFNKVAGTVLGYKMLFRLVGITCDIQQFFDYSGFDKGLKFDNATRTFDSSAINTDQTPYKLILRGPSYTTQQIENIIAVVVKANEPVDAKYIGYIYTNENIPQFYSNLFYQPSFYN